MSRWFPAGCLVWLLISSVMVTDVVADDAARVLFGFADADSANAWKTVKDGVMGGVSKGEFRITERGTMEFFGTLSLERNGGFASVRSKASQLGLKTGDSIVAKIKGDGREYSLNLYLNRRLIALSYRAMVQTKKDEWVEVTVPVEAFQATSFGRPLTNAAPVTAREINAIGFKLSDKQPGPFLLEIEAIKILSRAP